MTQVRNQRFNTLVLVINIVVLVIYLLTCLIPFLDPATFWFIAILGLAFPFLLLLVFVFTIIAAIKKSKWFFIFLTALVLSFQQVFALISFHPPESFSIIKPKNSLRILSWNVSSWTENINDAAKPDRSDLRSLMIDVVREQNADVLCFQEYFESYAPQLFPQNAPLFSKMGFTYSYFSPVGSFYNGGVKSGLCIFSRYPIIDTAFHKTDHGNSEGITSADIQFNDRVIRVINTHLESPRLQRQEYNPLGEVSESKTVLGKIKRSYTLRSQQSREIRSYIDSSKYPIIVCGDFNDIPNSYSYFKVKGNLQDAFLRKGIGIGRTFQFISPTLRIDYLLVDRRFKIEQFSKLNYKYSDHYPQVADLSFEK